MWPGWIGNVAVANPWADTSHERSSEVSWPGSDSTGSWASAAVGTHLHSSHCLHIRSSSVSFFEMASASPTCTAILPVDAVSGDEDSVVGDGRYGRAAIGRSVSAEESFSTAGAGPPLQCWLRINRRIVQGDDDQGVGLMLDGEKLAKDSPVM